MTNLMTKTEIGQKKSWYENSPVPLISCEFSLLTQIMKQTSKSQR